MRLLIASALTALALVAVPGAAKEKLSPEAQLDKMLEGRVAGEPQSCIPLSATNSTIIDGTALVYRVGNTLWVNRPRSGAETLDEDDILVTRTSGSQLCSLDSVQLYDRSGHMWRGFVSLDQFVPYRKAKSAQLD
ncbi:hypothetical protein [Sphingopyxis sp. MWB1]|uniref:hypothetical protein n=1 Tax=Sphingopyxis sp. MWB1 TaxID=1537715 RepID=UPI00051A6BBC|nr:hypothetical protein [Sphingopyxis sp. MWB1]